MSTLVAPVGIAYESFGILPKPDLQLNSSVGHPRRVALDPMSTSRLVRVVLAVLALALWVPATAFFALVGLRVARLIVGGHAVVAAPIADARGVLVTAAYSLGGAAVGLALAWLALPRDHARGLGWAAGLWLCVTAMLLVTRQVAGWSLLVAALVALGIGLDVSRRLVLATRAGTASAPSG